MSAFTLYFSCAFALAFLFAVFATPSHFCTMGAVSDWVNMDETTRLRAWCVAIAVALIGVAALDAVGLVDISMTRDGGLSNPPYRTPLFVWPRYLLGGLLFCLPAC